MAVKAQVLCEQAVCVLRQTTQHTIYSKATENVESSIKFRKFLQRFAVFRASRLQTQSFLQYLRPEGLEYAFGNDRTQQKRSEADAASQKDTTKTSKAITTMSSIQRCITQQHSTNPPLAPVPKGSLTLQRVDTSHSNPPPLEIGALEVECTAEIPTPTRLHTTLFPKVNRGETNGVSKEPMKRRRKSHHVPPIYIHRGRFVRCFNQLYQEALRFDNPSLIEIN